jgi:ribosomal protein S18 acetylase RimI-like enzyme
MLDDYSEVIHNHHAYVAEKNQQIIGVFVLIRTKDGILLDNVAVYPEYQDNGFGGRLVGFAESEARDLGFTNLDLYTHETMTENIEYYKRLGYVETEHRVERGYQRVYMRKALL